MIRYISLFSGIGAFEKALKNQRIPYELVAYSEIDKFASKSYAAIHHVSERFNLGDITKVDERALPQDIDLLTYGFPCQDISCAGRQTGLFDQDGNQTRSGLFFEALRVISATQPRVAIAENVKNLTSKKFRAQFELVLKSLEEAGYNNYWKVLNLKDFGVPQNRERAFIVSIRKNIDDGSFKFHEGFPLEKRLKDMLEPFVDEKYYMSEKAQRYITRDKTLGKRYAQIDGEVALTQCARQMANWNGDFISQQQQQQVDEAYVRQIGNCCPTKTRENPNQGRIYDTNGISPTLTCMGGGNLQPCIIDDGRAYAAAMRGRVGEAGKTEQRLETSEREYANAITSVQKDSLVVTTRPTKRIRKLTPKECFRLMGFDDSDWAKAASAVSDSQMYRQAGNSIGVPCVESILSALAECGMIKP